VGKFTGKRRKLNYKPIVWVAAVAVPVLIAVAVVIWPKRPVEVQFEQAPVSDGQLGEHGSFRLTWQTNVQARGTVYYRYSSDRPYRRMIVNPSRRHVVSIAAEPGETVELYVEVPDGRGGKAISPTIRVVPTSVRAASGPVDPGER